MISELSWILDRLASLLATLDYKAIGAIVGPLAAAYFGASTAQRIIERRETRQRLLKEIRNTNVAATMAFNITNAFCSLMKDHVRPLHEKYYADRQEVISRSQAAEPGVPVEAPNFEMGHLTPLATPIEQLQRIVFNDIDVGERARFLPTSLGQTIRDHAQIMELHNQLIDEFSKLPDNEFVNRYYGLKHRNRIDSKYRGVVDAMFKYTSDCIHFSLLLGRDLTAHARKTRSVYEKRFGSRGRPAIATGDFSRAEEQGLLPPASDYADWESMFPAPDLVPKKSWKFWSQR
jgi:hypothetical protein